MKNANKWLLGGLGVVALAAVVILASTNNVGNFFSGSVAKLTMSGQTLPPDTQLGSVVVNGVSKNISVNKQYTANGGLTMKDNVMTFDQAVIEKYSLPGEVEFKVTDAVQAAAPAANTVLTPKDNTVQMAPAQMIDQSNVRSNAQLEQAQLEMSAQYNQVAAPAANTVEAAQLQNTATYNANTSNTVEYNAVNTLQYNAQPYQQPVTYEANYTATYEMPAKDSDTSKDNNTKDSNTNNTRTGNDSTLKLKPTSWIPAAHAEVPNNIVVLKDLATGTYKINYSAYPNGAYHVQFMNGATLDAEFDVLITNNTCSDVDAFQFKDTAVTYKENDAANIKQSVNIVGVNDGVELPVSSNICKISMELLGITKNANYHFKVTKDSDPSVLTEQDLVPGQNNVILNDFIKLGAGKMQFDFSHLDIGGGIGTLQYGEKYTVRLEISPKVFTNSVNIELVPSQSVKPAGITAIVSGPGDQSLGGGDVDKEVINVSARNISGADQVLTDLVYSSLIKADGNGDFEIGKDSSAGVATHTLANEYYLDSNPGSKVSFDDKGKIIFSGLNISMPNGKTTSFKLLASKFYKVNENGRKALKDGASVKYYLESFKLADPATVTANLADQKASGLSVMSLPKDCSPVTSIAFSPTTLVYDKAALIANQSTNLEARDGATKLSLIDSNFCTADLQALGLDQDTSGLRVEVKDSAKNLKGGENIIFDNNPGATSYEILNKFITLSPVLDGQSNASFKFSNDLSKVNLGSDYLWGQNYTVEVRGIAKDKVTPYKSVVASYSLQLKDAPVQTPVVQTPAPSTTPVVTTTTTTTPAQPSSEACVVGDKTFYLAGGPNSSYCKDLQGLVSTQGESTVFKVDQPADTPQVRYTTALAVQRILSEVITEKNLNARIRIKNLDSGWYRDLQDSSDIATASSQEMTDFKTVYASGILRGRVNPENKAEVTLAPLSRIKFIELFALFEQGFSSIIQYTPSVSDSEMPSFTLAYKNDPNRVWMYNAVAFGIEFDLISRNEFSESTLQDYATRADMARFLARFKDAIQSNPSLLER
ncbi:hypothetical protein IT411_03255 [Candidatus Peregrinibacteria bacterium]|nr:hypothetical protein [Candidatus Peregrinibacteria bacterium]